MKIFIKLLFIIPVSLNSYTYPNYYESNNTCGFYNGLDEKVSGSLYKQKNIITLTHVLFLKALLTPIGQTFILKNEIQKSPDVPEIIKQFCQEKFRSQGLNPNQVKLKRFEGYELAAFGNSCIVFSSANVIELKNALENPNDKGSIKILKTYSIFIDHEIAHLKNNDAPVKRLSVFISASLISFGLMKYITNFSRFSKLFQVAPSTNNGYITDYSPDFINTPRFLMEVGSQLLSLFVYAQYAQFQEKRADAYATSLSNDAEALYLAADSLEKSEDTLTHLLSDAKLNIFSPFTSLSMITLQGVFFTFYKMQKTDEDFHSWIKRQRLTSPIIRYFYDIEHPSGFSRAQTMRKSANILENLQENKAF